MQATDRTREFIISQLEPLDQETNELKNRLSELESERTPLLEALKALGSTKRKKSKGGGKPSLPSVKKEDVQPFCLAFAKDNPNIKRSELEGLVEDKLLNEAGFGRNGMKMQIQKCLDSKLFVISEAGRVSIASLEELQVTQNASSLPAN